MSNPYIPQVDNFNAIEAFVRRVYNPGGDPNLDAKIVLQPYAYVLNFDDLAAGATANKTLNVAANADFVLTSPRYQAVVNTAGGEDVSPMINILLTDTGSQERLSDQAVNLASYFWHPRTAAGELTYPRIISGRSGLSVEVSNYSDIMTATIAYKRLELTFAGVLVRGFERR